MYLRSPTCLYHEILARTGKVFPGAEDKPIPHPGPDWVDSPAKFSDAPAPALTAERFTEATAAATEAAEEVKSLQEQLADARRLVEEAEGVISGLKTDLEKERTAHAETSAKLEAADKDLRHVDAKFESLTAEAEKVPALTEELQRTREQLAAAEGQVVELKAAIKPVDADGDGKPGGSPKKVEK